ncbi:MAG: YqgE/AlgH family protein [Luminiphilus sp.]|nr:YqgE/AlgH family protein [Luminiphilus sp.]
MASKKPAQATSAPASTYWAGHFLIATPVIGSGFFNRSLTYLCHHDEQGAMGIVVNLTLDVSVLDMLNHMDIQPESSLPDRPVLAGGPVGTDHGFVLHHSEPSWEGSQSVGNGVSLTTSRDILCALAKGDGPESYLVALGYAGWAPGQLEAEMADNSWLTTLADPHILFHLDTSDKLSAAGKTLGIDIDLLTAQAGHA